MFTESNLISFGNYLLKTYGVQVHSTDGKNEPLHQREVSHADIENWKEIENPDQTKLPSKFQRGDKAMFFCFPEPFPGIPCEIRAVHFFKGKVKYDLDLLFPDGWKSRIYNVDSALVGDKK